MSTRATRFEVGSSRGALRALLLEVRLNAREPRALLLVTSFRLTQAVLGDSRMKRRVLFPIVLSYRAFSELVLGIELRPQTKVGPGLRIYHGLGIVVSDKAFIGSNVTLRQNVTIGNNGYRADSPKIGDSVDIGAGAIVIGDITVGAGAIIGAGAVVTRDVASHSVVVGNPSRVIR